jgi:hypothetical protein
MTAASSKTVCLFKFYKQLAFPYRTQDMPGASFGLKFEFDGVSLDFLTSTWQA